MTVAPQPIAPRPAPTHHMMLDTTTGDRGMPIDVSGPLAANALDCGRFSAPWRVITTGPQAEDLAAASIASLGFEAFLPKVAVPIKQHQVLRPLFPGYLFARVDTSDATWPAIYRARGVEAVLTGVGTPLPAFLPEAAVAALRRHCDARQVIASDMRLDLIAAGVQVQIMDGPFLDHRGVCLWSSHQRVRLMLDVLGTVVNVPRRVVREA